MKRAGARRRPLPALGALAATATLLGAGGGATAGHSPERTPSRMLVNADEWNLVLSRTKLPRGPAIIEMYNRGEDPHNLRIRRVAGGQTRRIADLGPAQGGRVELRLRRGKRYRLWCSLPAHRERGMEATLKVARKRSFG